MAHEFGGVVWDGRKVGMVWWAVHELDQVVLWELNGDRRVEGAAYSREGDIADKLNTALCVYV